MRLRKMLQMLGALQICSHFCSICWGFCLFFTIFNGYFNRDYLHKKQICWIYEEGVFVVLVGLQRQKEAADLEAMGE